MIQTKDYSILLPLSPRELDKLFSRCCIDANDCWIWTGARCAAGYGQVEFRGRLWAVHRLIYELLVSHIPADCVVHHICRCPSCCNPAHLRAVTQLDNIREANIRSGANHHLGRLTHCKHGHPLSGDNVRLVEYMGRVHRVCRACAARNVARYRRRKLAAAKAARVASVVEASPLFCVASAKQNAAPVSPLPLGHGLQLQSGTRRRERAHASAPLSTAQLSPDLCADGAPGEGQGEGLDALHAPADALCATASSPASAVCHGGSRPAVLGRTIAVPPQPPAVPAPATFIASPFGRGQGEGGLPDCNGSHVLSSPPLCSNLLP